MEIELTAAPRDVKGTREAKKMRMEGKIPAVVYGHGFESILLSIDERQFMAVVREQRGLHGLFTLKVEGAGEDGHTVLVKEVQRDPIRDDVIHVDFQKIRKGEELTAEVSLQFTGEPAGVREGGILQHFIHEVTVQCLPKGLPDHIELDISNLNIKDNLRISDIPETEGVKYLNSPEEIVVSVAPKRIREMAALIAEEGLTEEELAEMVEKGEITAEEAAVVTEEMAAAEVEEEVEVEGMEEEGEGVKEETEE